MDTIEEQMRVELKSARDISMKYPDGTDIDAADQEIIVGHLKAYEELKSKWSKGKESDEIKSRLKSIGFDLGLEYQDPDLREKASAFVKPERRKSLGAQYTESAQYKALWDLFPTKEIGNQARVQTQPFGVKALITGASDTSGGAFVQNDVQDIFELLGRRELTIRDLISVRQTDSDTVEYVRQTSQLTAAAPVAEATTSAAPTIVNTEGTPNVSVVTPAAGGGYKPEGTFALEKVTATVRTIAEWVAATKRALADAAQLRGLIDDELREDLAEEEESQILTGSGSGENLTGILNTSGVQTQAWSSDLLTTLRKAKTKARTIGRARGTISVVLNPEDAERVDLLKAAGGDEQFYGPGPFAAAGIRTIWGMPVVESEAMTSGVGLVGDYKKAVLWDREQASITATDSHADFFIRNLVAVLGEERVAFGVTRPTAFVNTDLTA